LNTLKNPFLRGFWGWFFFGGQSFEKKNAFQKFLLKELSNKQKVFSYSVVVLNGCFY